MLYAGQSLTEILGPNGEELVEQMRLHVDQAVQYEINTGTIASAEEVPTVFIIRSASAAYAQVIEGQRGFRGPQRFHEIDIDARTEFVQQMSVALRAGSQAEEPAESFLLLTLEEVFQLGTDLRNTTNSHASEQAARRLFEIAIGREGEDGEVEERDVELEIIPREENGQLAQTQAIALQELIAFMVDSETPIPRLVEVFNLISRVNFETNGLYPQGLILSMGEAIGRLRGEGSRRNEDLEVLQLRMIFYVVDHLASGDLVAQRESIEVLTSLFTTGQFNSVNMIALHVKQTMDERSGQRLLRAQRTIESLAEIFANPEIEEQVLSRLSGPILDLVEETETTPEINERLATGFLRLVDYEEARAIRNEENIESLVRMASFSVRAYLEGPQNVSDARVELFDKMVEVATTRRYREYSRGRDAYTRVSYEDIMTLYDRPGQWLSTADCQYINDQVGRAIIDTITEIEGRGLFGVERPGPTQNRVYHRILRGITFFQGNRLDMLNFAFNRLYERIESDDPELRGDVFLVLAELFETHEADRAFNGGSLWFALLQRMAEIRNSEHLDVAERQALMRIFAYARDSESWQRSMRSAGMMRTDNGVVRINLFRGHRFSDEQGLRPDRQALPRDVYDEPEKAAENMEPLIAAALEQEVSFEVMLNLAVHYSNNVRRELLTMFVEQYLASRGNGRGSVDVRNKLRSSDTVDRIVDNAMRDLRPVRGYITIRAIREHARAGVMQEFERMERAERGLDRVSVEELDRRERDREFLGRVRGTIRENLRHR